MGSSPALTIGSAVIGDIYKVEQRGTALGIFYAVGLFPIELQHLLIFLGLGYSHGAGIRTRLWR